jgi:D-3-phosphoglycerate dehydrogenase
MRVLIADSLESEGVQALERLGCTVMLEPSIKAEELPGRLGKGDAEVLIVRSKKVPRAAIEASKNLRAIIRAGAGVDNIDSEAATERGIGVCNCPGMNSVAVAELALGLIIACDRRITDQTAAIKAHRWDKKGFSGGAHGLKGSTLCIVGFGAIGRAVAHRAAAFEMTVAAWDRHLTPTLARERGIAFAGSSREELLAFLPQCDVLSVHLALTPETRKFCNAEFFARMKPGATFINTARGDVVDEAAMCRAAAERGLRLGLDVYENQPAASGVEFVTPVAPLIGAFTHHCGASTDQSQRAVADETVRIVQVFMETGRLENCVNASALASRSPASAARSR